MQFFVCHKNNNFYIVLISKNFKRKSFGGIFMANKSIYEDIALRTGGDIYLGIVGPVRTCKSTFIKQFMDKLVMPNISE